MVVVDATVVGIERETLRGWHRAIRGVEGVSRVKLLAKLETAAAGGEEGSAAVLRKRAEAEPT